MAEFIILIFVFIVGFSANFVGAIAGGGGLISILFLIFAGLPPQIAIATNKLGEIGSGIGKASKFIKEKKVVWEFILPFSIISLIGGCIGANILLNINQEMLSNVVGFILLLLLPTIFIKKEMGQERVVTTKKRKTMGYL
ncbi:hypothetical protein BWK69_00820 [Candidatus Parcubacteria bacterium A4]|nr:MAG: hypothetical protein BWK69_00820 [Candidatus Parcubacteria bacterium A4]